MCAFFAQRKAITFNSWSLGNYAGEILAETTLYDILNLGFSYLKYVLNF